MIARAMSDAQGDLLAGAALVEEARSPITNTSDPMMRALVDFSQGTLALCRGDLTRASSHLETALAEFSERVERTLEIGVLYPLGRR